MKQRVSFRALEITLACVGIVVASPLMLLIAIAIVLETGRPIFFAQTRVGRRGHHFRMFKFRKFKSTSTNEGVPLTTHADVRFSRIGGILAASKLDELPQLYNVLKGDMSLVGPRPESIAFSDCFVGPYSAVLEYQPGVFGPSQVMFRNECSLYPPHTEPTQFYRSVLFPLKAELDLSYYPRRTFLSDSLWIVRGVLALADTGRVPVPARLSPPLHESARVLRRRDPQIAD
jgi:lipopolysaccharide/colanic/teichoic acid biosynthesis glycosyltransferase